MLSQEILAVLVYGILAGSTFSLIALGLSLIFGVAKIIDFTYVAYITLASYFFYALYLIAGSLLAIVISIIAIIPLAFFVERFFIRPLKSSDNRVMLVTFGLALLVAYLVENFWGDLTRAIPAFVLGSISIFGDVESLQGFLILPVSIAVSISLLSFLEFTKRGKAIVAVSQDINASWLVGINVGNMMAITIVIGGILAAIAATVTAPTIGLTPGMGWSPFVTAFVVVVLGGLGSVRGSLIAAYVYGILLNAINVFIGPQWQDTLGFVFLIAILLVRPNGVLGKSVTR